LVSPAITNQTHYEWGQRGLHAVSDSAGRRLDAAALRSLPVRPEPVEGPMRTRHLRDDFGRTVLTASPDSGVTLRTFDAADRLIAMRDALGNEARYEYDAAGRVVRQMVQAKHAEPVLTQWRYQGRHLVELIHPTQSERYTYDANGWRTGRTVVQGNLEATARYTFDAQGQLAATTLPDGSRIGYERNGQSQVTAITRRRVHTPWLQHLEQPQVIASDFERDIVGLKAYTAGNGIQARFIRSREGTLARVLYRQPQRKVMTAQGRVPQFIGRNTQDFFERFMGIVPAHAAEPVEALGAVREPIDAQALIDHRYLWDVRGNLLLDAQRAGVQPTDSAYAYDGANRLIVAQTRAASDAVIKPVADKPAPAEHRYYLHDAAGRRVLARQDGATRRIAYDQGSHRWTSDADTSATYDAAGQPATIGARRFDWDAHGRLLQVREGDQTVARYGYSHRGERIEKKTASEQAHYLYDDASQLLAELDASGAITRQYVYVADLPIAVIDGPTPLHQDANAWLQAWRDVQHLLRSWIGKEDTITWLHTNHLGAPEAATDAQGQLLWQASYAPSGRAKTTGSFMLNLRLPGQYADTETGLHYNLNRYYDPERGQYLSPDPLANAPGYPDGPNPYAYVRYNPLRYVDPLGLILFAFDGTDNTDDANWLQARGSSLTNVVHFRNAYDDGNRRYIAGVGTDHRDNRYGDIIARNYDVNLLVDTITDRAGNYSGPDRIARMMRYMNDESDLARDDEAMNIDIIGFSRGAAQARDFANRLVRQTRNGWYRYTATENGQQVERCQRVNFRFMGLWDTVLAENRSAHAYQLGIPAQFRHVAQAVALNEYRSRVGTVLSDIPFWNATRNPQNDRNHYGYFPLESITGSGTPQGATRIELGFIGAHADIGGGYGQNDNQLSRVALSWMVAQAQIAGVRMNTGNLPAIDMNNPVVHDPSNAIRWGNPLAAQQARDDRGTLRLPEDRRVNGACNPASPGGRCRAGAVTQRDMQFTFGNGVSDNRSMTNADTHQFIDYAARNPNDINTIRPLRQSTGTVNMQDYMTWLRNHGYVFHNE
jgi:RHS repeat-associated protein